MLKVSLCTKTFPLEIQITELDQIIKILLKCRPISSALKVILPPIADHCTQTFCLMLQGLEMYGSFFCFCHTTTLQFSMFVITKSSQLFQLLKPLYNNIINLYANQPECK